MDGTAGRSLVHLPGDTPRVLRASCKLCLATVPGELGERVCVCVWGGYRPPVLGGTSSPIPIFSPRLHLDPVHGLPFLREKVLGPLVGSAGCLLKPVG